ncbi:MAG: hypothetical protein H6R00_5054, partial [Proteobacteria bacterium]|nr:hypothetical protein [Pseudomonadota bacterium]
DPKRPLSPYSPVAAKEAEAAYRSAKLAAVAA